MKHRGDLMSGGAPLLAGLDLVKAHGRTPALRGASITLAAGEILAGHASAPRVPARGGRHAGQTREGPDRQAEMPSIRAMASSAPYGCR